jgi:hypothetical protein
MKRMIWLIVGSVMGFVFGRTVAGETVVNTSTVGFVVIVLCLITFAMGRRNKAEASATAVATAVANAQVEFDAQLAATATALAQNAVTIYMQKNDLDGEPEALVHSAGIALAAERTIETSTPTTDVYESVRYM